MMNRNIDNNYPILTKSKDFILFLHNYIYSDGHMIDILKNKIESHLDLFQINYIHEGKCFELKVKKTTIKKMPNYTPDSHFYDNIVDNIMYEFITDIEVSNLILNKIEHARSMNIKTTNNIEDVYKDIVNRDDIVSLLYTVIPVSENLIIIEL